MTRAVPAMATLIVLVGAGMVAGVALNADSSLGPRTREIRFWVEEMPWEIHLGVETMVWAFCAEGDGVEPVWNGPCGVPGPTVRVVKGDTIRLTFENTHTIAHTVHFHGWHTMSADMNGAALVGDHMVVQPGQMQRIEWVAEPAGSFIYHCHFQTPTHMDMGMYGAFIVEDPEERRGPDIEFVAVLDEWAIHNRTQFLGSMPDYNFFTINGRSFPTTQLWSTALGDRVRIHMVNAGFEFRAMHLHGYTPDSWEGVAGPRHAVPTDVRSVAPGQTVVLDFIAAREGVWLFHDHVVPRVTAASDGTGFGAYPRGMLTLLTVGDAAAAALAGVAPELLAAAARDAVDPEAAHGDHGHPDVATPADGIVVDMKDYKFAQMGIKVSAGATITWNNLDPVVHTVTADDGSFDSGGIGAGKSWSQTFTELGTYTYHCVPHAYEASDGTWKGMVATVIVE